MIDTEALSCQELVELVTDYFEGALDTRALSQVEEHLVMCDWCRTYVEQVQATVAVLEQLPDVTPPDPPEVVLAALRTRRSG